jgi:hypothetical protein
MDCVSSDVLTNRLLVWDDPKVSLLPCVWLWMKPQQDRWIPLKQGRDKSQGPAPQYYRRRNIIAWWMSFTTVGWALTTTSGTSIAIDLDVLDGPLGGEDGNGDHVRGWGRVDADSLVSLGLKQKHGTSARTRGGWVCVATSSWHASHILCWDVHTGMCWWQLWPGGRRLLTVFLCPLAGCSLCAYAHATMLAGVSRLRPLTVRTLTLLSYIRLIIIRTITRQASKTLPTDWCNGTHLLATIGSYWYALKYLVWIGWCISILDPQCTMTWILMS